MNRVLDVAGFLLRAESRVAEANAAGPPTSVIVDSS
jgi:hypothetical protein